MTRSILRLLYRISDRLKEGLLVTWLWLPLGFLVRPNTTIPVIASLTTYPPRIGTAWLAIETLLRQSVKPERLMLVLNTEEFPTQKLPCQIQRQTKRGLEILWVPQNGGSHDKLLPVRALFPHATVVTFDDDKFFPSTLLEQLFQSSQENPTRVVGARGWMIRNSPKQPGVHYGEGWTRAKAGDHGKHLLTPGGNGCLYPASSLHPMADDSDAALRICPTADDIWFWGALYKNSTELVCLGLPAHRPVSALKAGPALSTRDPEENDEQFQKALDHFRIRKRLLSGALPEVSGDG